MNLLKFYNKHGSPELLVYIAVWTIVILVPVATAFFELLSGNVNVIHWQRIFRFWIDILPFFILFLLNNKILLPLLFFRQKITLYAVSAIFISVFVFSLTDIFWRNRDAERFNKFEQDRMEHILGRKYDGKNFTKPGEHLLPGETGEWREESHHRFPHPPREDMPFFLPVLKGPFFGRMLIALLMFCFSLAVKLFFKSLRDKEAMKELEHNNLQTELEYLKYQINPHFFMNTLNNIHALVDINTEKAKQTLVELSRLMRYVLYESNKRTISLSKEGEFLRHYVELMRIRYTDNVKITLSIPDIIDNVQVPPLLFITFVENAFKHGISYRHPSFVLIELQIENDEILFHCENSNFSNSKDQYHGIGLDNVRKRLLLLYGDRHKFFIDENEASFNVRLIVPINI